MAYYAVAVGRVPGIYSTWEECKRQVLGCKGAKYKKFEVLVDAERFICGDYDATVDAKSSVDKSSVDKSSVDKSSVEDDGIYIYTDGACINNGKPEASAAYAAYFGSDDPRNISVKLPTGSTNNVAELSAIIYVLELLQVNDLSTKEKTYLMTDSKYSILCLTTYGEKMAVGGWKTPIPNKELVRRAFELYNKVSTFVEVKHVEAHTGRTDAHSVGNNIVDKMANSAAAAPQN